MVHYLVDVKELIQDGTTMLAEATTAIGTGALEAQSTSSPGDRHVVREDVTCSPHERRHDVAAAIEQAHMPSQLCECLRIGAGTRASFDGILREERNDTCHVASSSDGNGMRCRAGV